MYIPIILGTAREGRQSEKVANFVHEEAKKYGQFETELLDVKDYVSSPSTESAMTEDRAKKWKEIVEKSDGLIIVSPEYNHSFPGELKLMLDQLYEEYNKKPLGICGVSSGKSGGIRMVEALRLVSIELKMFPMRDAMYFSEVATLFDDAKKIEIYSQQLKNFFGELLWHAKALKSAREEGNRQ